MILSSNLLPLVYQPYPSKRNQHAHQSSESNGLAQIEPSQKNSDQGIDVGVQRSDGRAQVLQGVQIQRKGQSGTHQRKIQQPQPPLRGMVNLVGSIKKGAHGKSAQAAGSNLEARI